MRACLTLPPDCSVPTHERADPPVKLHPWYAVHVCALYAFREAPPAVRHTLSAHVRAVRRPQSSAHSTPSTCARCTPPAKLRPLHAVHVCPPTVHRPGSSACCTPCTACTLSTGARCTPPAKLSPLYAMHRPHVPPVRRPQSSARKAPHAARVGLLRLRCSGDAT